MADKNIIVAGAYKGAKLVIRGVFQKELELEEQKLFNAKRFTLTRSNVRSVDILDTDTTKSASSAILRTGAGAVLLGGAGLAAGLSAKNKKAYQVKITFSDNKESLAIIDSEIFTMLQDLMLNSQGIDKDFDFYEGRHDDEANDEEATVEVSPAQATPTTPDITAQLTQLVALKNAGALTEEEFTAAKNGYWAAGKQLEIKQKRHKRNKAKATALYLQKALLTLQQGLS